MAGQRDEAEGPEHGCQGQEKRDPRRDQSPERDDEDDQRDREGKLTGFREVVPIGRYDGVFRAREPGSVTVRATEPTSG